MRVGRFFPLILALALVPDCRKTPDLLDGSRAFRLANLPGDDPKATQAEKDRHVRQADELLRAAIAEYKIGRNEAARLKLEEALTHHATGKLYYHYGVVLSNLPGGLSDAIKAYEIALHLGTDRPELALYNMACAYSLLDRPDKSYEYLARALDAGYSALGHIAKDPDLANMRARPDWQDMLRKAALTDIHYRVDDLVGVLETPTPGLPVYLLMCANGTAILPTQCEAGFKRGTWKTDAAGVQISVTEDCAAQPQGEQLGAFGNCMEYRSYSFSGCRPAQGETRVAAIELRRMLKFEAAPPRGRILESLGPQKETLRGRRTHGVPSGIQADTS